jgi:hypothetical protein
MLAVRLFTRHESSEAASILTTGWGRIVRITRPSGSCLNSPINNEIFSIREESERKIDD